MLPALGDNQVQMRCASRNVRCSPRKIYDIKASTTSDMLLNRPCRELRSYCWHNEADIQRSARTKSDQRLLQSNSQSCPVHAFSRRADSVELELNQLTIFCTVSQLAVPLCNVIKGVSVVRAKEPCGPHRHSLHGTPPVAAHGQARSVDLPHLGRIRRSLH